MPSVSDVVTFLLVAALRIAHGMLVLFAVIGGLAAAISQDSLIYEYYFLAGAGLAGMPWSMPFAVLPEGGINEAFKVIGCLMAAAINGWLLYRHRLIRPGTDPPRGQPRARIGSWRRN